MESKEEQPKKGVNRGNAGKGRPKGSANKENKALREMILQALDDQPGGGVEYLKIQATDNPTSFMTLLGKVLPTTLAGDPTKPLQFELLTPWLTQHIQKRN